MPSSISFRGGRAAAVVGSANCSAAAWRAPVGQGGNRELVVVYDHCDRADFSEALKKLEGGGRRPGRSWKGMRRRTGRIRRKARRCAWWISSRTSTREAHAGDCPASPGCQASPPGLVNSNTAEPGRAGRAHITGMPPDIEAVPGGNSTHFARLVFKLEDGSAWETVRWLDEEHELSHLSIERHMAALERLDRRRKRASRRRSSKASPNWQETSASPKIPRSPLRDGSKQTNGEAPRPAVDPHELVKSILEVQKNPPVRMGLQGTGRGAAGERTPACAFRRGTPRLGHGIGGGFRGR
jgi:hypothetical protein